MLVSEENRYTSKTKRVQYGTNEMWIVTDRASGKWFGINCSESAIRKMFKPIA